MPVPVPICFPAAILVHDASRVEMPELLYTGTTSTLSTSFVERNHFGFQYHTCVKAGLRRFSPVKQENSRWQMLGDGQAECCQNDSAVKLCNYGSLTSERSTSLAWTLASTC